jgi:hypothetical protein
MGTAHRATLTGMEDLIGTAEVTRILGVDKATVLRRIKAGLLVPAMKMPSSGGNGAYLFERSQVMALKETQRKE